MTKEKRGHWDTGPRKVRRAVVISRLNPGESKRRKQQNTAICCTMLRVTPIYGSRYSKNEPDAPTCTLIEYDGTKVLVNVGWKGSNFHQASVIHDLPTPDCVLLTDSTLQSVGGLPGWWWKRRQRLMTEEETRKRQHESSIVTDEHPQAKVPIYATFPTVKMGQMTLYDQHAALCMDGGKPPYTLEAVDDAIGSITAIKYAQHISVGRGKLNITAYAAGHTVGGAFFVLQRPHDDTTVVVTPTKYNIARERVLNRSTLLQNASSPDVYITSPGYQPPFPTPSPAPKTPAAERLTDAVLTVLRGDGHVLLPTDAAGRCLELLLHLHHHWESQRLQSTYNLVWLAPLAHNVYDFARSQLEWTRLPFDAATHPLGLGTVQRCTSVAELDALLSRTNNPTCVVASGLSMDGKLFACEPESTNESVFIIRAALCGICTLGLSNTIFSSTTRSWPRS